MRATLPRLHTLLPAILLLATASAAVGSAPPHFALRKSAPEDGAMMKEVAEVKLWFTEAPSEGTVSIRLLDADGELVPSTDATPDPDDPTAFAIVPDEALAPAAYDVRWRGMGDDGHVVRGDLSFTVGGR